MAEAEIDTRQKPLSPEQTLLVNQISNLVSTGTHQQIRDLSVILHGSNGSRSFCSYTVESGGDALKVGYSQGPLHSGYVIQQKRGGDIVVELNDYRIGKELYSLLDQNHDFSRASIRGS